MTRFDVVQAVMRALFFIVLLPLYILQGAILGALMAWEDLFEEGEG